MHPLGVGMLVVGAAGLLLRSVHVFRKNWPKLDRVVFAAFLRVKRGLVLLLLWQSSAVISGCVVLGLKVLGAAPD